MEAAKKARAEKHNGDCMGACHTYDACMKNIQNKKERGTYDISINAMHSKASREKPSYHFICNIFLWMKMVSIIKWQEIQQSNIIKIETSV